MEHRGHSCANQAAWPSRSWLTQPSPFWDPRNGWACWGVKGGTAGRVCRLSLLSEGARAVQTRQPGPYGHGRHGLHHSRIQGQGEHAGGGGGWKEGWQAGFVGCHRGVKGPQQCKPGCLTLILLVVAPTLLWCEDRVHVCTHKNCKCPWLLWDGVP